MLLPYQSISLAWTGFVILRVVYRFVRRKTTYSLLKLLTPLVVWGGLSWVLVFPESTMHSIASWLGIQEGLNALIFVGFVVILFLFFRMLAIIEKLEKKMNKMVRHEALRKLREEKIDIISQ